MASLTMPNWRSIACLTGDDLCSEQDPAEAILHIHRLPYARTPSPVARAFLRGAEAATPHQSLSTACPFPALPIDSPDLLVPSLLSTGALPFSQRPSLLCSPDAGEMALPLAVRRRLASLHQERRNKNGAE
ncbi:hypothetical protein HU200_016420 [Digitaria exilis]|uniref:Uncharacterized protein n=1 Tax=Digitaria exilis TaxID=1010633 RepID=A0A835F8C7_9POAL|nr:hypothetical protein HU200_016420 [Digitaria exilis]